MTVYGVRSQAILFVMNFKNLADRYCEDHSETGRSDRLRRRALRFGCRRASRPAARAPDPTLGARWRDRAVNRALCQGVAGTLCTGRERYVAIWSRRTDNGELEEDAIEHDLQITGTPRTDGCRGHHRCALAGALTIALEL